MFDDESMYNVNVIISETSFNCVLASLSIQTSQKRDFTPFLPELERGDRNCFQYRQHTHHCMLV